MTIKGMRVAILAEDEFEDSELLEPLKTLRSAGADVTVIGSGSKTVYAGKKGQVTVHVDSTAGQVNGADFDAIIIPGGHAPDKMRLYHAMVEFVRQAYTAGRIIAAVCHGPQLLISAGVLDGKTVTCWPSVAIDVQNAGARYVDEPVVRDGNLITSRKPDDLRLFNQAIVQALEQRMQGETGTESSA